MARSMLALSLWAAAVPSFAGNREDAVLNAIHNLQINEQQADIARISDLHGTYLTTAETQDRRLVSLALGVHYIESNPRLALQYLTSAELNCREKDPLLPIVHYYLAETKFRGGAYTEALALVEDLLVGAPSDAWLRQIQSLRIESLYALGEYERLVDAFGEYSKRFSFSRRQETLARMAVEAFEQQEDDEQATELLEELARNYPATEESRWAFHKLQEESCKPAGKQRYYFSQRLLLHLSRNAMLDSGLEQFIVAMVDRPLTYDDGKVRYMSGQEKADFFFKARFYKYALKQVKELFEVEKRKPSSTSLPNLEFEIGRIHLRMFEPMLATRAFSDFLFDYPKHPLASHALEFLGDALRYSGEPLAAAQNYAEAIAHGDSHTLRWMQFWSLYRGKDYQGALALLERPGYVTPRDGDGQVVVTYWHARLLERLGRKAEADQIYTRILNNDAQSFYALLVSITHPELTDVAGAGGALVGAGDKEVPGLAAKMLDAPVSDGPLPTRADLKLVDQLLRVGLKDAASRQLAGLRWTGFDQEEPYEAITKLSAQLGDYRPARNLRMTRFSALKNLPTNWKALLGHQNQHADEWKMYFPLAFDRIIMPIASSIRISPFLVMSVMRTESYYNKDARSGVGAQGLMQLMPYTAVKIATLLKDEDFDVRDLNRPSVNLGYGAYYLDKLLRYYEDNPFLAVAAYNGGPMVVNQWLDSCKDCAADEFVDSIPYSETRHYVRDVMRNYAQYVRIYTGKPALPSLPEMPTALPDGEEIF